MQVPTVGSKVIVKTRFSQGASMIPPRPTETIYIGTVLAPYKWLTDREFCLSGDKDWPIRVINMSMVNHIELIEGKFATIDIDEKIWTVKGSKGNTYTVSRSASKWNCTCPGFSFRKTCKHVSEYKLV